MFFSVFAVALLAEGVDRNLYGYSTLNSSLFVALLAEGVDRNIATKIVDYIMNRRPPRGGRG